jgi:2-methylcitrate dehydratase PrpD
MKNTGISPEMKALSEYIAKAINKPVPAAVASRAKIHLIDSFAAIIAGSRLLPGQRATAYVKALGGTKEPTVIGTGQLAPMAYAALANGMCAHADENDDTHPPTRSHPGSSVVPASFAIAEHHGLSGQAFLRAVILGYDVCARVMLTLAPKYVSSSFGHLFGAAAASAALLKLDARQVRHVLTYAGQQASGLYTRLRDPLHVEKAFAVGGMGARNGVESALMVRHGFSGVDDVFSGQYNFLATHAPEGNIKALARALGREYEILRGGIKCWSAGGPIQGPLHVLQEMMQQHGLQAAQIEQLTAHLPEKELALVTNREASDISLEHLLALMLVDGGLTFATSHDVKRMKDRRVLTLRRRVQTVGAPHLTDPLRRWRCEMTITLKDGRVLKHHTLAAKGTSVNPVSFADEEHKALDLMSPVLGERRARKLIATLACIDEVKNMQQIRKLCIAK